MNFLNPFSYFRKTPETKSTSDDNLSQSSSQSSRSSRRQSVISSQPPLTPATDKSASLARRSLTSSTLTTPLPDSDDQTPRPISAHSVIPKDDIPDDTSETTGSYVTASEMTEDDFFFESASTASSTSVPAETKLTASEAEALIKKDLEDLKNIQDKISSIKKEIKTQAKKFVKVHLFRKQHHENISKKDDYQPLVMKMLNLRTEWMLKNQELKVHKGLYDGANKLDLSTGKAGKTEQKQIISLLKKMQKVERSVADYFHADKGYLNFHDTDANDFKSVQSRIESIRKHIEDPTDSDEFKRRSAAEVAKHGTPTESLSKFKHNLVIELREKHERALTYELWGLDNLEHLVQDHGGKGTDLADEIAKYKNEIAKDPYLSLVSSRNDVDRLNISNEKILVLPGNTTARDQANIERNNAKATTIMNDAVQAVTSKYSTNPNADAATAKGKLKNMNTMMYKDPSQASEEYQPFLNRYNEVIYRWSKLMLNTRKIEPSDSLAVNAMKLHDAFIEMSNISPLTDAEVTDLGKDLEKMSATLGMLEDQVKHETRMSLPDIIKNELPHLFGSVSNLTVENQYEGLLNLSRLKNSDTDQSKDAKLRNQVTVKIADEELPKLRERVEKEYTPDPNNLKSTISSLETKLKTELSPGDRFVTTVKLDIAKKAKNLAKQGIIMHKKPEGKQATPAAPFIPSEEEEEDIFSRVASSQAYIDNKKFDLEEELTRLNKIPEATRTTHENEEIKKITNKLIDIDRKISELSSTEYNELDEDDEDDEDEDYPSEVDVDVLPNDAAPKVVVGPSPDKISTEDLKLRQNLKNFYPILGTTFASTVVKKDDYEIRGEEYEQLDKAILDYDVDDKTTDEVPEKKFFKEQKAKFDAAVKADLIRDYPAIGDTRGLNPSENTQIDTVTKNLKNLLKEEQLSSGERYVVNLKLSIIKARTQNTTDSSGVFIPGKQSPKDAKELAKKQKQYDQKAANAKKMLQPPEAAKLFHRKNK